VVQKALPDLGAPHVSSIRLCCHVNSRDWILGFNSLKAMEAHGLDTPAEEVSKKHNARVANPLDV
jgi:hypothetical protein